MTNDRMAELIAFYGEPMSTYTRAQMIADGSLVAVDRTLFGLPVAMTAAAYADCVAWTDADDERKREGTGQSPSGRLHDVITMATYYGRRDGRGTDRYAFTLRRVPREGRGLRPAKATLHAVLGGDDNGTPCVTIMMPSED